MQDIMQTIAGLAISTLIGTYILQWATEWVAGFKPRFGIAFAAVLAANVIVLAFWTLVGEFIESPEPVLRPIVIVFLVPVFVIDSLVY